MLIFLYVSFNVILKTKVNRHHYNSIYVTVKKLKLSPIQPPGATLSDVIRVSRIIFVN